MTSGAEMGRRQEKSSFSLTCSLLRQYIKEKGSPADLGLGMPPRSLAPAAIGKREAFKSPMTMNLLPGDDHCAELKDGVSAGNPTRSKELFPILTDFRRHVPEAEIKKPEQPQLTIFYGGKVLVFDNFPAEKADDLMQLASKSSGMASGMQSFSFMPSIPVAAADPKTCPSPAIPPATFPLRSQPNLSDLPIARKASLHRFLEKRKGRISAKAPYPVSSGNGMRNASGLKEEDISKPWLGLGTQISS